MHPGIAPRDRREHREERDEDEEDAGRGHDYRFTAVISSFFGLLSDLLDARGVGAAPARRPAGHRTTI